MRWWLHDGRVIDPATGADQVRDLFVDGGRLVEPPSEPQDYKRVDCSGQIIAPGFIDLFAAIPRPRFESLAAAAGGFVRVVAAGAPSAAPEEIRNLEARALRAECRVSMAGAVVEPGAEQELASMGLLVGAGAAALSDGGTPVRSSRRLRAVLEYAGRFPVPLMLRPTDWDLEEGGVVREGPVGRGLGLPAVPPEAERIGVHRIATLAARTKTRVHLTHLWSQAGVDEVRRARGEGLPITASTTIHHLLLDQELVWREQYAGRARFRPPLGDVEDRRALWQALQDGVLTAVTTDNRPLPAEAKEREFELAEPGAIGFQTALPTLADHAGGALEQVLPWLTTGPAEVLGLRRPSLEIGEPASLVVVDPDAHWKLDHTTNQSISSNTPWWGRTLRGAVRLTLLEGRLTWSRD